jgi:hypothetical protein
MEGAMDPIILATITSALTLLSTEVAKCAQSPSDLAPEIARKLAADSKIAKEIVELLQAQPESSRHASTLADKVIVAGEFKVSGDFHM